MLTAPKAGKDVEQQEFSFISGRNTKWYSHFRNPTVSYKAQPCPTIGSSNCSLSCLPKMNRKCTYNLKNLEEIKMPFNR